MAGTKVMRTGLLSYINTHPGTTDVYDFMGQGFVDLSDALGAKVDSTQYINDDNESSTVTGYSPEWSFSGDVYDGDPAIDFLRNLALTRATGADLETDYVSFLAADVVTNEVDCYAHPVIVVMESVEGGAGGEKLSFSGSLKANGDPVAGSFNTSTKVFTPDVS
jgi:hypothetical protein